MPDLGYPPVILDIIEEHFEELDFLLEQRESVVFAPDWNLFELGELEERAEAHLDGLRLAQGHAIDIARPSLTGDEIYAAAAATHVFMASGDPALIDEVLAAFVDVADAREGIRRALRHARIVPLVEALGDLTGSQDLSLALAAADVLSFHRAPTQDITAGLEADEPADRVLAWTTLGRQGGARDPLRLRDVLTKAEPTVCLAALQASVRSGLPDVAGFCRTATLDADAPSLDALGFLGVVGDAQDRALLEACARDAECAATAIGALGGLGRLPAVPLLIEIMGQEGDNAFLAAEAFKRISGLADVSKEKGPPPPIDEADVDAEFEEDMPPPDPEIAAAWWRDHGESLDQEARWLGGANVQALDEYASLIAEASMENRRDLILGAAAAGVPGAAECEYEASARRQLG